jgi:conjugal transfer pilus assembly protein TraB
MMFLSYQMGGRKSVPPPKPAEQKAVVPLDQQLLEKSLYQEKERELRQRDEQIKELKADIEEIKKEKDKNEKGKAVRNYPPVPVPSPETERSANNEPRTSPYPLVPPLPAQQGVQKQAEPELVGKIEVFTNPNAGKTKAEQAVDKKKEGVEKIYLPPSFMPAVLMTGVRAKTGGEGKGEPQPLLLRITDLAVLPNRITKDLKDCFVIANAMGDLAQERADVRLVSMNCLARDGSVAIKQNIKGTVVDADGVLNLDGKVVARWGSTLAASMYSGFFAGLGDGLKAASSQTLITASGTLQQIKPGDLLMGAAGSGVSTSFHKVADFMLEIARQATPVVEVGNLKKVTVFITEGVDLEVKKYCDGLRSLGGARCKEDI